MDIIDASFTYFFTEKFDVNHAIQIWEIFPSYTHVFHEWKWTIQRWNLPSGNSRTNHASSGYSALHNCPAAKQCKDFYMIWWVWKLALLWNFEPRNISEEKFTYGMAVVFKTCYIIRLRGTKEGHECASIGYLEIFSMSSSVRQRKSRGILKEQERYKRYLRGRTGAHERNNRGTEDVQQRYMRWTTEVQQRPYTELRIHNTSFPVWKQDQGVPATRLMLATIREMIPNLRISWSLSMTEFCVKFSHCLYGEGRMKLNHRHKVSSIHLTT